MDPSKIIKQRRERVDLSRVVGYGENGGAPFFRIARRTDELVTLARKEALDQERPWKTEKDLGFRVRRVENVDEEKAARRALCHLIRGWSGLTVRGLELIVEPGTHTVCVDGGADAPVPSPDDADAAVAAEGRRWLEALSECVAPEFRIWVSQIATESAAYFREVETVEGETSGSTPGGG